MHRASRTRFFRNGYLVQRFSSPIDMTLVLPQLDLNDGSIPDREKRRLEELYSMHALDTSSDERFRKYTELLATSFIDAPIASVVLVDRDKLVIKSAFGRVVHETRRENSFAAQAMQEPDLLIVEDALKDPRFATHPLVTEDPFVRSYAGAVIRGPSGQPLGALCVMDTVARAFSDKEQKVLLQITRILENELQNRATVADLRQRIREQVLFDPATQLPTEALFAARLARVIERNPSKPIMIAVIRLERFEAIHSAVGRPGAAYLVKNAATRIETALRRKCLIGHVREDTLAVAFALRDRHKSALCVDAILECFGSPFLLGEHTLAHGVLIGTAMHPEDGPDSDTLLKRARTALHSMSAYDVAKWRRYERDLSTNAALQFEIETALRSALVRNELQLAFQPKIDIGTNRLVGAEALLRWTSPQFGEIPPAQFIPIAEESGLIVELGDWVLATACRRMADWRDRGYECPKISVNVSCIQLRQPDLCRRVQQLLIDHSLAGSKLALEVTESTLVENMSEAIRVMSDLRALNVGFAIDDFGKGFCSLSYLAQMPVQMLKIDRSFIEGIPERANHMTIVKSIVAMGHALGLRVVAEGVETAEQLKALADAGCDHAQGFLIGRPLSEAEFAASCLART